MMKPSENVKVKRNKRLCQKSTMTTRTTLMLLMLRYEALTHASSRTLSGTLRDLLDSEEAQGQSGFLPHGPHAAVRMTSRMVSRMVSRMAT